MSFTLCHCAGNMFQPTAKRLAAYARAAARGDVLTFTEASKDHDAIKSLGLSVSTMVELVVAWSPILFDRVDSGGKLVLEGGKAGALGSKGDNRKRGPNRYCLWVVLKEKSTGQKWLIGTYHGPAKPDTGQKWRQPLANLAQKNFAAEIRKAQALHPGAQLVVTGDFNRRRTVNLGLGLTELKTPGTLGSSRYDRIQVDPDVKSSGLTTFATGLDHLAVSVRLSVTGATPTPVPARPEVPMTSTDKLIATAKKYVGVREGRNNDNRFAAKAGFPNHQAWCASFVVAVFKEAGLGSLITTPSPGVDQLAAGFKRAKRWSEYPAIGAVVCFGKPSDLNHTGIVVAYDADTITTVEGNTNDDGSREGNGVYLKKRQRRAANVVGYGYPAFAEGIKSADPSWARKPPVVKPTPRPDLPKPGKPTRKDGDPWPIDGIDLSHHNDGKIDWPKAKAAGVKFVYHKATQDTDFVDNAYAKRRAEVKAQGLPFGAYHYAEPRVGDATRQARKFLSVAKPKAGDLRPMLDLEETGGLSMAALTVWVREFVAEVKRQTGNTPVIYTKFDLTAAPAAYLWTARYSNVNALPHVPKVWADGWTIHQFSNGEFGVPKRCPGIPFPCDLNTLAPGFDLDNITL